MEKERLDFLRKEYYNAVHFCNELSEDLGHNEFADPITAEDNFWSDIYMLALFPLCLDHNISKTELSRFQALVAGYETGYPLDDIDPALLSETLREESFEEPKTLIVFALRATVDIIHTSEEDKDKRIEYNLGYLDYILCHYADLMVSIPDELTPNLKNNVMNCLNYCCDKISKTLNIPFTMSKHVTSFVEGENASI